jgi:hypothetical protein
LAVFQVFIGALTLARLGLRVVVFAFRHARSARSRLAVFQVFISTLTRTRLGFRVAVFLLRHTWPARPRFVFFRFFLRRSRMLRGLDVILSRRITDGIVEPLADAHPGATGSLAGGLPRFGANTLHVPRNAKSHA